MQLKLAQRALQQSGYSVQSFATATEAADYLVDTLQNKTIGFGGSMTLESMNLWERLRIHNTVFSHLHGFPAGPEAAGAQIYISSVNALSEEGEMVLIDGDGNRASAVLFGHEKVIFVIGRNKISASYEEAVWRAKNVAGPLNARRKRKNTPCALKADHCYDCKSPERICRAMVTLWRPMSGMDTEVLLIDEDLGF